MNKTPNIDKFGPKVMDSLPTSAKRTKKKPCTLLWIHNHIFYYITIHSQLQEEK